jgi:SAM-dependent methyltransferase
MNSPSAARNAEPILKVFKRLLRGRVLEIGCGTGEHAVYFAEAMPELSWLPTDPDGASRTSTASWIRFKALTNVLLPLPLDASAATWDVETLAPFDAVVSINMVHIAPWEATLGLLSGAGRLLRGGGLLLLYGPFLQNGVHNAPSNAAFDESLKELNPSWGLRDIAKLEGPAGASGLQLSEIIEMPANNRLLVFHRGG